MDVLNWTTINLEDNLKVAKLCTRYWFELKWKKSVHSSPSQVLLELVSMRDGELYRQIIFLQELHNKEVELIANAEKYAEFIAKTCETE